MHVCLAGTSSGFLRFRVLGLLGQDALASWIEARAREEAPGGATVRASATTGVVRIRGGATADAAGWAVRIESWRTAFGAPGARAPALPPAARPAPLHAAATPARLPATARPRANAPRRTPGSAVPAHAGSLRQCLERIGSSPHGLATADAAARLKRDGPNEIADVATRTALEILAGQFASVPVALLGASAGLALATRAPGDAAAIAAVLAANGGIGYYTERQAEATVSALRRLAPRSAKVLRDGVAADVPAREVVVGDVLLLNPGEAVAADARVIESHRLSANEAPLTGESLPVHKAAADGLARGTPLGERRNMVHMGTVVSGGSGRAVVTAVGAATSLGNIRALAQAAEAPRTRLQAELDGLGTRLALGAAGLCVGALAIGVLRRRPLVPLLRTAVSLGVAAIPEGLPTVATSLLASGIRSLQKRGVYARSLDAVESLGAVDVVGFDKTGTLTENRMRAAAICLGTARHAISPDSPKPRVPAEWGLVCALCNDLELSDGKWRGSSTELALLDFAADFGFDVAALRARHPVLALKQRSEHHPYMVTLNAGDGRRAFVAAKGRPVEVLERCTHWHDARSVRALTPAMRRRLLAQNARLATAGYRVLALACRRQPARTLGETGGLTWLGLVGLADPVRPSVPETIRRFRAAGIRPLMVTGDQLGTAQAVAAAVGLGTGTVVVDAAALPERAEALGTEVERAVAFARSTPLMKLELIRALQKRGHVVAMTGDGINDGPALKAADVGVAMGVSGTDFAHAMSDLVLQGDHPSGLLDAIAEGRTAYLNVKKAVRYLVATNLSELCATTAALALGLPEPLDPLALLWINLITDVSPAIALGLEPPEPDVLDRPPLPRSIALLDRNDWRLIAVDAGMMTACALASYAYGLSRHGPGPRARTMAFMTLAASQIAYALVARSEGRLDDPRLRPNPLLKRVVLASLALQLGTVLLPPLRSLLRTAPLGPVDLAVVAATSLVPPLAREVLKRGAAPRGTTSDVGAPARRRRRGGRAT